MTHRHSILLDIFGASLALSDMDLMRVLGVAWRCLSDEQKLRLNAEHERVEAAVAATHGGEDEDDRPRPPVAAVPFWSVGFEEWRITPKRPARWRKVRRSGGKWDRYRLDAPANMAEFRAELQEIAASEFLSAEPRLTRRLECNRLGCFFYLEGEQRRARVVLHTGRLPWGDSEWREYLDALVMSHAAPAGGAQ